MKKLASAAIIIATVTLTACGDQKEANDSNFKVALQQYLDKKFPMCPIHELQFPTKPITMDFRNNIAIYDEMVKVGLMTKKTVQVPMVLQPDKTQPAPVYDISPEGKKYYVEKDTNTLGGVPGLCGGKAKVAEVVNFSQPSDMFGHTISQVKFTYTVSDIPDWMKSKLLSDSNNELNQINKANGGALAGKAILVLTGKGWMEESVFNAQK